MVIISIILHRLLQIENVKHKVVAQLGCTQSGPLAPYCAETRLSLLLIPLLACAHFAAGRISMMESRHTMTHAWHFLWGPAQWNTTDGTCLLDHVGFIQFFIHVNAWPVHQAIVNPLSYFVTWVPNGKLISIIHHVHVAYLCMSNCIMPKPTSSNSNYRNKMFFLFQVSKKNKAMHCQHTFTYICSLFLRIPSLTRSSSLLLLRRSDDSSSTGV